MKVQDQIVVECLNSIPSTATITSSSICQEEVTMPKTDPLCKIDYEKLYKDLLEKSNKQEKELLLLKKPAVDYKKINDCLRQNMIILQKNLNTSNSLLLKNQKNMKKELKLLSMNKIRAIKNEATKLVFPIFSKNQLDIILKKKKRVNWSTDEIAKAFTLRYFSKRAYLYVRHELHHPLPGKNNFI